MTKKTLAFLLMLAAVAAGLVANAVEKAKRTPTPPAGPTLPGEAELRKMAARFAPTELKVDVSGLSEGDRKALIQLIQAARIVDDIFLAQIWSGNRLLLAELRRDTSPLGKERLRYFLVNKSPWSALDGNTQFLEDVPPRKLPGANFYPTDMSKQDLEAWMKGLSSPEREKAQGFFTMIRSGGDKKLHIVPYSDAYRPDLTKAADLLKKAAELTDNVTLRTFLTKRAEAFLSNDYHDSDVAWMDLDAPIDVTIGPYETYNDELFGYKAAFEAYVTVRDEAETKKLGFFAGKLQDVENNLPIDPSQRNPKLGALSPIHVVNELFGAGDGNHGVQTAAYNLPNDEKVVSEKGSKKIMLKNVQEAKFQKTLVPISEKALAKKDRADLSFDAFFTHILAHELTHGIGPHQISVAGRKTTPRQELKDLYGAIEEAKADVTGLFALQWLMDHDASGALAKGPDAERRLYTTFLASSFRTLRFGVTEAHARGMALQVNFLVDKGGFVVNRDGTFAVDAAKIKDAVKDLDHELLTLEATGDYARAKKMLDELGVLRPPVEKMLDSLKDVPIDIQPIFVTAESLAPGR